MPAVTKRHIVRREGALRAARLLKPLFIVLAAYLAVQLSGPPTWAKQTREQCNDCCTKMGYDEYYLEQCKLKCFRNHDYCKGSAVKAAPEPEKKPKPKRVRFRWPKPLNLTPGKEWEAAGQILALNGIAPGNPNYQQALTSIQKILVDFVQKHPSGGKLPTGRLERILRRYK